MFAILLVSTALTLLVDLPLQSIKELCRSVEINLSGILKDNSSSGSSSNDNGGAPPNTESNNAKERGTASVPTTNAGGHTEQLFSGEDDARAEDGGHIAQAADDAADAEEVDYEEEEEEYEPEEPIRRRGQLTMTSVNAGQRTAGEDEEAEIDIWDSNR